ncbi:major histocompatibility complex class I-related gene protein-like isoform X1 [Tiliqua scincoides]|uniref:major histocompatibility complex class I-related gene protein-like isoform X1 n=2 Tax=Tiliqua scincoides TaxID=71010 RepID=UPI0034622012
MGRLRWPGWLLGALLLLQGGCPGASSHSARYFLTAVSEPGQGLPQFTVVAYADDQLIGYYDSNRRRIVSPVPWVQKIEKEDPQLWDMHTQRAQNEELYLGWHLADVQKLHNQSGGLHTWQSMSSCELHKDGRKGGRAQYAYDGRDFLAFDKETLTWTAASSKAQVTKRSWDVNLSIRHGTKVYLEEICMGWLWKYLEYGKETLLRKERPLVKVTRKDSHEGLETLLCRAHGFYPREIDVTWRKDGEVREGDTFRGVVSPNVDGTYYTWLSIEIDPKERSRYRCHVEHDGLEKPLDLAVEVSASVPGWLIAVGIVSGVLAALLLAVVIVVVLKKRPEKAAYGAASTSDPGSDSSARA